MNGEFNSNQSEMLHAYLDGEATSTEEHVLFSALAENEDLRNEMRDLLAIRNAVHGDKEAFAPPLAATAAIFAGLGFSNPASASAVGTVSAQTVSTSGSTAFSQPSAPGATQSLFSASAQSWIKPLIGALISSALTASFVTMLLQPAGLPTLTGNAISGPAPIQLIQEVPESPMLGDLWVEPEHKQVTEAEELPVAVVTETDNTTEAPKSASSMFEPEIRQPVIVRPEGIGDLMVTPQEIQDALRAYFGEETKRDPNFILQLSTSPISQSYYSVGPSGSNNDAMQRLRTGLFYIVGEHHAFGIEGGYDALSLQWEERNQDSISTMAGSDKGAWLSAAYRFQTGDFTPVEGLKLFGQFGVGGVVSGSGTAFGGFFGRSVVGIQYELFSGIFAQIGLEGTMHIYKMNYPNTTRNYWITNGLNFNNGIFVQF